ncbi:MAG: hypothetical protein LBN95_01375 [Prevotellaceae bacterium]|nr:hypothetical protein [Prevotellaceae bacterium]
MGELLTCRTERQGGNLVLFGRWGGFDCAGDFWAGGSNARRNNSNEKTSSPQRLSSAGCG